METKELVIDSEMTIDEMLVQNSNMPAPVAVLSVLASITVRYFSFDRKVHQGQIVVHKKVAIDVSDFFEEALRLNFPVEKVIPISSPKYSFDDNLSCDDNNSSGYNFRYIAGTNNMSKHALGLAFDINPLQNPYIRYDENAHELWREPKNAVYDEKALGTLYAKHPLVKMLKDKGWKWGGDWRKSDGPVDYQHFESPL